jgi:formate hydrogenlyase subunit 4
VTVPAGWNIFLQVALFFGVQVLFALTVGLIESFRARNKMNRNPKFILTISAIGCIAFLVILILTRMLNQ